MFHKFTAAAREHVAKHAFALPDARVLALLVLDVDIESVALKKQLQVTVVLQNGVRGRLVEHALQGSASRLNEVGLEAAHSLLLWRRRDDDAGVVVVQLGVEPEEVAVAAGDGEVGVAVALGGRLGGDGVLRVRAREVAHLVRVADVDGEGRLCGLLDAHTRLRLARWRGACGCLYGRRHARALRGRLVGVCVVEAHRVHEASQRRSRCVRCKPRAARRGGGLLLRRRWGRGFGTCGCCRGSQRAQRVVDGLELGRLGAILASSRPTGGGRARGSGCGGRGGGIRGGRDSGLVGALGAVLCWSGSLLSRARLRGHICMAIRTVQHRGRSFWQAYLPRESSLLLPDPLVRAMWWREHSCGLV